MEWVYLKPRFGSDEYDTHTATVPRLRPDQQAPSRWTWVGDVHF